MYLINKYSHSIIITASNMTMNDLDSRRRKIGIDKIMMLENTAHKTYILFLM